MFTLYLFLSSCITDVWLTLQSYMTVVVVLYLNLHSNVSLNSLWSKCSIACVLSTFSQRHRWQYSFVIFGLHLCVSCDVIETFSMYSKKIQNGSDGHCSIEDAKACMELVQLKIKNGKFVFFIFTREQISDSLLCVTRLENPSFRAGVVLCDANSQDYQQQKAYHFLTAMHTHYLTAQY